jgi:hypothetical protein
MDISIQTALIGLGGVAFGAVIGVVAQIILAAFDFKKWQREKRIETMRLKKADLEKKYIEWMESAAKAIIEGTKGISHDSFSKAFYFFPETVFNPTMDFMNSLATGDKKAISYNFNLVEASMNKSLVDIDQEIAK